MGEEQNDLQFSLTHLKIIYIYMNLSYTFNINWKEEGNVLLTVIWRQTYGKVLLR